jgi:hypothetical protein
MKLFDINDPEMKTEYEVPNISEIPMRDLVFNLMFKSISLGRAKTLLLDCQEAFRSDAHEIAHEIIGRNCHSNVIPDSESEKIVATLNKMPKFYE